MNQLVIIGASGHGKVVADIALNMNKYKKIVFLDDDISLKECMGFPVVGVSNETDKYIENWDIFVAVGNAEIRQRIQEILLKKGASIPVLMHPNAVMGKYVSIGAGTVVMAGAVINSGCVIGMGCIINTCSSVDHDCWIGDYAHISVGAHLAGTVKIGNRTWVGIGASVGNNIKIVAECMIGAGAVVIEDIEMSGIYVGIPVTKLK